MVTKVHSDPRGHFMKLFFVLKHFMLYFVTCYRKNPNQYNHTSVSHFVSYFIFVLDGVMTTQLSLKNTFPKIPFLVWVQWVG